MTEYAATESEPRQRRTESRGWTLRDLVLVAVLGAVFGFLYYALVQAWGALSVAMGPSGDLAQNILWGGWLIVAPLALYITRRPGAGIVAEVLASIIEIVILGSPVGPRLLITALVQGVGSEAIFAITRYRRWNMPIFVLSGLIGGLTIFIYEAFLLGWWGQSILFARLGIHLVSCIVIGGVLAKVVGDLLLATGTLDNFAIGRAARGRR